MEYFMNFDVDTDDNHVAIWQDFWINYEFDKAFNLFLGKAFVPGNRDWLNGSTRTRFVDRSMTTTFFRPDRTIGLWAIGEPVKDVFYRVMVGNGIQTADVTFDDIDTQFVYSASSWMNLGDYGSGYSDLEWHECPAAQIGHSFTYAGNHGGDDRGLPLEEEAFVRLSDGTRLTQIGALAPGVIVDDFNTSLYAVDAAFKYAGFSCNGEYSFRWVNDIQGDGALPITSMFDHGFYVEGGYMLIPERFELNVRTSQIYGDFGDAEEYAAGANWFINGTHNWKLSFDAAKINDCPTSNSGANYRAGDDGVLFRTQLQAAF
jgi:hypothetical protein